ncbi:type II toxin-antitoxin system RelE/ParE family toxin [Candidatus Nitrospira neomarina]|uniref:Type II toxin-antitoxin system RelE/ParE family toxin n=1 Tax=Candidatus Nitrospira neomarina TaxID=3020899 RepID=A0AA96K1R5_9BACT|nr:type II toxin-antitoxin system RelE/ParE family toxin [Candidatus Nitrospira neomarina]WNM63361.1 type II toxin-antitoxin system RelE/ParE family toxin [Candidatus Nitrospira neomarina]
MKIRILGSALEDLHSGRQFYENQAEGVGEYFFDAVFADIDSLALYAGIHQKFFGYHRLLARRFPYAIYYKMADPNTVIVQRVLDLRQHPQKIKTALT